MLDWRLMPTMILIYLLNYIDRTAVTSARLKGLEQDLHLNDIDYETILAILYASYCPAQIPGNMVTRNFAGILLCRVFIGLPEAAFYPGAELSFRGAILYAGLLISNAFGSGAITMVIGFLAMYGVSLLPTFVRLAEDAGEADEDTAGESIWDGIRLALTDVKVYIFALMSCSQLLALSFVNFFPTYVCRLRLTCLTYRPPWIWAAIACVVNAWHCDRTGERFWHLSIWWWGVIIGYIIGLSTMATGARYFSLFLMASGYAGFALTVVWVSNTIPRPPAKRSVAIGIVNGFGNLGNLIGSFVWKAEWGPEYHQSMIIGIASMALAISLGILMRTMLKRENARMAAQELREITDAERERIEDAAKLEGITFEEALERRKGFRYLY
ncbi:MFS general substrate transporter [Gloeophyllum trabeum ATCC 11539]|uniref:MFS general substrate transporter n=1 Tax=Gloeophyllum trabeum (strain ATCC 11539 / FP-39264 / Madison 617) TaxID=670483 RepID=S7Q6G7_GLOTA|nr:MFS general substrate transporter [Gloeophyllum trabeum ATCC 11539]EPQ55008.1 MFS general substrate transporter [Gloeophyllum trabeum ATCC 11539]